MTSDNTLLTICTVCGHDLDIGDKGRNDFVPHCNRFHVVGNAALMKLRPEKVKKKMKKVKVVKEKIKKTTYAKSIASDIKNGLNNEDILKRYPIKLSYLRLLRYKVGKGVM